MWNNNLEHDLYPLALQFYQHLPEETRRKLRGRFNATQISSLICMIIIVTILSTLCIHIYLDYLLKEIPNIPITGEDTAPSLLMFILLFILDIIFLGSMVLGVNRLGLLQNSIGYFEKRFFMEIRLKKLHREYFIPKKRSTDKKDPEKIYWRYVKSTNIVKKKEQLDDITLNITCLEFHLNHSSSSLSSSEGEAPYIKLSSNPITGKINLLGETIKEFCEELIKRNKET